jgi:hypothetical protein
MADITLKVLEVKKMSVPNHDEMKGKWEQAKGWVKDKTGEATNNPDLEAEARHKMPRDTRRKLGAK